MIRPLLITVFALLVSFAAQASAEVTTAEDSVKESELSFKRGGKVFKKKKTNKHYYRIAAKKKRKAQWHRRSLLRTHIVSR